LKLKKVYDVPIQRYNRLRSAVARVEQPAEGNCPYHVAAYHGHSTLADEHFFAKDVYETLLT
jgi:hypothetical protein